MEGVRPDSEGCSTRAGGPMERLAGYLRPAPRGAEAGAEAEAEAERWGPPGDRSHHPVGKPDPALLGESQSRCYLV